MCNGSCFLHHQTSHLLQICTLLQWQINPAHQVLHLALLVTEVPVCNTLQHKRELAIDLRGHEHLEKLISILEGIFHGRGGGGAGTDAADYITEAAVLLFGRVARHIRTDDKRLKEVITRLVDALKTPSEVVQSAVSDCLPPLLRLRKEQVGASAYPHPTASRRYP
jgi:hypothetical protein